MCLFFLEQRLFEEIGEAMPRPDPRLVSVLATLARPYGRRGDA